MGICLVDSLHVGAGREKGKKEHVLSDRKFPFIKDPLSPHALFLDTLEPLKALGYVILMAALR